MHYSRTLSQIIADLRAALPGAHDAAGGATTHDNALPSVAFHDIPECAVPSLGGAAGDGASCCHSTPSPAQIDAREFVAEGMAALAARDRPAALVAMMNGRLTKEERARTMKLMKMFKDVQE